MCLVKVKQTSLYTESFRFSLLYKVELVAKLNDVCFFLQKTQAKLCAMLSRRASSHWIEFFWKVMHLT